MSIRFPNLPRLRSRRIRAILGGVLVALPLALGGAHPEVNAGLALVMASLLGLTLWSMRRRSDRRAPITLTVIIVGTALTATLIQLVPLPAAFIRVIAPGAHDVLSMSLGPKYGWAPLSMDPPATCHEVLKLVALSCGALLGVTLFRTRTHRHQLLIWISVAGGTTVALGLLHSLAGLDRPYGTFGVPRDVLVSSFVNPNHLAGFLGLSGMIAVGLAMDARGKWRAVHLANAVMIGAGVFLSLSRGGILAYVGSLLFLGAVVATKRANRIPRVFAVQVVLAGAVLLAGYVAYTEVAGELWTLGEPDVFAKADVWQPAAAIVADFPISGVGRGAFSFIYSKYRLDALPATFTHLENEWLQTLVDWGLACGILLLLCGGAVFLRLLRRASASSDPSYAAAAAAVLFLAAHNLGDFNLTLTAIGVPVVLLLGALTRPSASGGSSTDESAAAPDVAAEPTPARRRVDVRGRRLLPLAGVLGAIAIGAASIAIPHTLRRDTALLIHALGAEPDDAERDRLAASILRRHPADYLLPLIVAQRLLDEPDGGRLAMPWINRGMYLAPKYSGTHTLAGRALLVLGARTQALDEYRLAAEAAPGRAHTVLNEVWSRLHAPSAIATIGDSTPAVRLAAARFLVRRGAPQRAYDLAGGGLSDGEAAADFHEVMATALHDMQQAEAGLAHAEALQREEPTREAGYRIAARIQVQQGHSDAALATLERGIGRTSNPEPLLQERARVLLRVGRLDEARTVARRLRLYGDGSPARAQAAWLLGQVYLEEGRAALALRELERARDLAPRNLTYRLGIARARETIGDLSGARDELVRARTDLGSSSALERAIARIESRHLQKRQHSSPRATSANE